LQKLAEWHGNEVEDFRSKSLRYSLTIEMEDPRAGARQARWKILAAGIFPERGK